MCASQLVVAAALDPARDAGKPDDAFEMRARRRKQGSVICRLMIMVGADRLEVLLRDAAHLDDDLRM